MISFSEVQIGTGGALSCVRCSDPAPPAPRPLAEVEAELERLAAAGAAARPDVAFTGHEPFAHPELPAIIAAAVSLGFGRIRLRTDGGALAGSGNAEGVIRAGVRHFEIVVFGASELHDRLTGRPGLFRAATAGCEAVRTAAEQLSKSIFVSARIDVCRHNAAILADAVIAAGTLGAQAIVIDATAHRPTPAVLETALDTATAAGVAVSVLGMPAPAPYDQAAPWTTQQVGR